MSIYMYLLLYPILESFFWSFSFVTACRRSAYFSPRFNPRPRTGGDYKILFVIDLVYVSIHAPARGATHVARLNIKYPLFQSTPPHGGRQHLPPLRLCSCHVSIHAPARGATLLSSVPLLPIIVSIHAPARGATFFIFLINYN